MIKTLEYSKLLWKMKQIKISVFYFYVEKNFKYSFMNNRNDVSIIIYKCEIILFVVVFQNKDMLNNISTITVLSFMN